MIEQEVIDYFKAYPLKVNLATIDDDGTVHVVIPQPNCPKNIIDYVNNNCSIGIIIGYTGSSHNKGFHQANGSQIQINATSIPKHYYADINNQPLPEKTHYVCETDTLTNEHTHHPVGQITNPSKGTGWKCNPGGLLKRFNFNAHFPIDQTWTSDQYHFEIDGNESMRFNDGRIRRFNHFKRHHQNKSRGTYYRYSTAICITLYAQNNTALLQGVCPIIAGETPLNVDTPLWTRL